MTGTLPRIWIITKPDHPSGPIEPIRRALEACPSARVGVQLRAKSSPDRELLRWAAELRALTLASGSALAVNRRIDVAEIVGADAVHLPERGLPIAEIRARWPGLRALGVSRHDRDGLLSAEEETASYAFLSPVFPVPEKGPPLGLDGFSRAIADVGIPTYGLGGLGVEHLGAILKAGAYGIAIRRSIYDAERPGAVLEALLHELDKRLPKGE